MSSLMFKALIDGVHFDPKKGAVKIQLIAASHVSMDKLTSLGPADESVKITLESAQTKIIQAISPEVNVPLKEGGEEWLKKAADELTDDERGEEEVEEQLDQADEDDEEDDEEGLGDGLI